MPCRQLWPGDRRLAIEAQVRGARGFDAPGPGKAEATPLVARATGSQALQRRLSVNTGVLARLLHPCLHPHALRFGIRDGAPKPCHLQSGPMSVGACPRLAVRCSELQACSAASDESHVRSHGEKTQPAEGSLNHSSAQRSLTRSLATLARTGYVPSEAPGTMGYYTPRDSIVQSTEALGQSSLRNPVRAYPCTSHQHMSAHS